MIEFLTTCVSGPVLPATVLLGLLTLYWLLVILGALELDVVDVDLDLDLDSDLDSFLGTGFIALRFLNIGQVPLMVWLSVFGMAMWLTSVIWYHPSYAENAWIGTQVLIRNAAIALVATKLITQPLVRMFDRNDTVRGEQLVGQLCVVNTSEVNEDFGQARLHTSGAPLLLNVRSREARIEKGEVVEISEFDPEHNVYYVIKSTREVSS